MNVFINCACALLAMAAVPGWCGRCANLDKQSTPLKSAELNLPDFGRVGAGGDDTAVFRRALAEGSRLQRAVHVPAARLPYRVGPLYLPSHTVLLLDTGTIIQARPGFTDGQKLINIDSANTVQVIGYGAVLRMNRAEYRNGEYRHCISITGSSQVAIKGITCNNPGGNGIYIGPGERTSYSDDVTIEDITVKNSLSAALKIASARGVTVRRSHFLLTSSGVPSSRIKSAADKPAGIELFPTSAESRLEQIRLEDNETIRSSGDGIRIVLSDLRSSSTPVAISIVRHRDVQPGGSSYFGTDDPASGQPARGEVDLAGCRSEEAQDYGAVFSFWRTPGVHAMVRDLTVINPDNSGSTMDNAAVAVKRGGGGHGAIGDVDFVGTTVQDTRPRPKLDYYFTFADYSHVGIEHVSFRNAGQLSGAHHEPTVGLFQGEGLDKIEGPEDRSLPALWQMAEKRASGNAGRTQ